MAEQEYIRMMRDSLERKTAVLKQIQIKNREQGEILQDRDSLPEALDQNVSEKETLIRQIIRLDDGFENMYNRVKETLSKNRDLYRAEIREMQMMIEEISDLSMMVQAQEQHNRKLAEERFSSVRGKAKEVRQSRQVVNSYYRSMMDRGNVEPQFWDSKK